MAVGEKVLGRKMGWFFWFEILILMGVVVVEDAVGFHATAMCAQIGQANWNLKFRRVLTSEEGKEQGYDSPKVRAVTDKSSYYTIGAYKFRTTHIFLDASFGGTKFDTVTHRPIYLETWSKRCPYVYHSKKNSEFCVPQSTVEMRTFAVKQNGIVMNGWLHFEIELKDKSDEIYGMYIQVRDEWFNAIGEFVSKPEEQCPTTTKLAQPSIFQYMPCSAVGFREAKVIIFQSFLSKDIPQIVV